MFSNPRGEQAAQNCARCNVPAFHAHIELQRLRLPVHLLAGFQVRFALAAETLWWF